MSFAKLKSLCEAEQALLYCADAWLYQLPGENLLACQVLTLSMSLHHPQGQSQHGCCWHTDGHLAPYRIIFQLAMMSQDEVYRHAEYLSVQLYDAWPRSGDCMRTARGA